MYEKVFISGKPCLIGDGIEFINEDLFGLQVGEYVTKIGKYKSSSSYDSKFSPYAQYVGKIEIDWIYAAFRLPKGGVSGWTSENQEKPVYLLLTSTLGHPKTISKNFYRTAAQWSCA